MHRKIFAKVRSLRPGTKNTNHRRIITDFAERSGMLYFGFVSQLGDEHK